MHRLVVLARAARAQGNPNFNIGRLMHEVIEKKENVDTFTKDREEEA